MARDRPRAWQYMGGEPVAFGLRMLYRGDLYIARHPWTPDDVPLTPPVEVTAEDVAAGEHEAHLYGNGSRWNQIVADRINQRLAARQEAE